MGPILIRRTRPLREALYALAMEKRIPDAQTLDAIVCRYPEFGDELTDFAIELVLDAFSEVVSGTTEVTVDHSNVVSPTVSRAISRFHNRLYLVRQRAQEELESRTVRQPPVDNPLVELSRTDFRALASRVGTNTVFLAKLRDRQIEPHTIPVGFSRCVADALELPGELLAAHLEARGGAAGSRRQFYKADSKPSHGERQSFVDAVKNSGLSAEAQRRLLSY